MCKIEDMKSKAPVIKIVFAFFILTGTAAADGARETPVVKVVRECAPSVVNISTERLVRLGKQRYWGAYGRQMDSVFDQHFVTIPKTMMLKGVGSGVIVSETGLVMTNAHVVNMASKIFVILSDNTACEARVDAISQKDDIAILQIKPLDPIKPVRLAGDVMIGETVVSIGNPLGLENSVSAGIVSGMNRVFKSSDGRVAFDGLIQTDASINMGSSVGALFNLDGELIGINLAVVQGAQSIGFAIPAQKINTLLNKYKELKQKELTINSRGNVL